MNRAKFFSVTLNCDIQGRHMVPGVCYILTDSLLVCILDMASKGTASLYMEEVRFVTGVPYAVSEPRRVVERLPVAAAAASSPSYSGASQSAAAQTPNEFTAIPGIQGTPTILSI